jgi:hypothetical protein
MLDQIKDEFEKIGVKTIKPFVNNGRWVFNYNGSNYDLAPTPIMNFVMSPTIVGVDNLLAAGCKAKNIKDAEKGFLLLFSEEYFPNCDVLLKYKEPIYNGHVYHVESMNMKIPENQSAWICPYLGIYFKKNPQALYIKIEELNG